MPPQDQLEIIKPSGGLEFVTLDWAAGVTNIGRNPANDVVLDSPKIGEFSLMLDHREKPYRITALSDIGAPTLVGRWMVTNQSYEIHDWETVEVGGYSIVLLEDHAAGKAAPAAAAAATVAAVEPPPEPEEDAGKEVVAVATAATAATAVAALAGEEEFATVVRPDGGSGNQPFPDMDSESIVVELSQREITTDVEQRATWELTVINGGPIVAAFQVHVEGWIDGCWVAVVPDHANLFEGARADFTVSVSPPRQPTSRAGVHYIAIVVTSPNYPGERTQRAATLIINPYRDFRISELAPRSRSISYFTHGANYELSVRNLGNDEEVFQVQGSDDQAGVSFEFELPDEEVSLARQADLELEPDQEIVLPIHVTPNRRRVIGARRHDYALTITTSMRESQLAPRSVLGILGKRPLIGPWVITALMVLAVILALIIFRPRIEHFDFAPGTVQSVELTGDDEAADANGSGIADQADQLLGKTIFGFKMPKMPRQMQSVMSWLGVGDADATTEPGASIQSGAMVDAGQQVTLVWDTVWATNLTIEKEVPGSTVFIASIENPFQQREFTFVADQRERAVYVLRGSNAIDRIPIIGDTLGRVNTRLGLIVDPVRPELAFDVNPLSVVAGEPVDIAWEVDKADAYDLVINGAPRPLSDSRGSIQEMPQSPTEYQLVARSNYWDGPVVEARRVAVVLPTPFIREFAISPNPIVDGEVVAVTWRVDGASIVTINPIPGQVPNPEEGRDEGMVDPGQSEETFVIVASVGEGAQAVQARATRVLPIVPPTPTITPTPTPTVTPTPTETTIPAPLVRSFDIQPKPIVEGDIASVDWVVEGATSVEILPVPGSVPNLLGSAEFSTDPGKSQETFTLLAVNTDGVNRRETRATRVVNIVTPTPTITPTPTPSPTITPVPPKILQFQIAPTQIVRGEKKDDQNGDPTDQLQRSDLSWTVSGDATNIEIVGSPEFGPVSNLEKEGRLSVLPSESTTYQLNAYLGEDVMDSRTVGLEILEPTETPTLTPLPPTPVPTETPTPGPTVAIFSVAGVDGVVSSVSSVDDIPTFELNAGTLVRFGWLVTNPSSNEIKLISDTSPSQEYPGLLPEGNQQALVKTTSIWTLAVASLDSKRIRLEVLPIVPPPAPSSVTGDWVNEATPSIVRWSYPNSYQDDINGFRVYRAPVNTFTFDRVADEDSLLGTARFWQDPEIPSCDWAYYLVAVYTNIVTDQVEETEGSATSWQSGPCATPVP